MRRMRKVFGTDLCLSRCTIVFFASMLQAFGIYHIHSQAAVTEGGILGLTLLLQYWWRISPAVSSLIANIACYTLGWKTMGKRFLWISAFAVAGFSAGYALFEQFPPLWPQLAHMPLTAAIAGALFIGIGAGITVRAGGATTGDDALAMSLSRLLHVDIRWIYLVSDLTVLLLSLSYIPLVRIAYSLLTVILSGQIIGWIQNIHSDAK